MAATTPTRRDLLRLYRQYLSASQSFSSYNFRLYFLRRSRDLFRSNLLPASQASLASPLSPAAGITTPKSPSSLTSSIPSSHHPASASSSSSSPSPTAGGSRGGGGGGGEGGGAAPSGTAGADGEARRLATFYETAKKDLEVLRRAALTNRMYEGERLVVEAPQLVVGGGAEGAETGVGGGGQAMHTAQGKGGAPSSDSG